MGSFLNTKDASKDYYPLIVDFQDVSIDISFEYFQVIDSGKKFGLIGVPDSFDFGNKDLDSLNGKAILIDNLWKEPIASGKFTEVQALFIGALKQLDPNLIYAGTVSLSSRPKEINRILGCEKPLDEVFTAWKIADSFDIAAKEIDGFKLPKMSPSPSKSFAPKENESDRIMARQKFILGEYNRIFGDDSAEKLDKEMTKDFWEIIKIIVG